MREAIKTRSPHPLIALALLIACPGHAQSPSSVGTPPPVPERVMKNLGNIGEGTGSSSHRFTTSFPESLYAPLNDPAYGTGATAANRLSDAQMSTAFTEGLAAWRRIGNHGSCISCHSPDTFDLALIGYSDADVTRRALDHVTAAEAAQIVQLIKATRQRYSIERPLHPQTFRPRQPGYEVLPGTNAENQDLAFANYLNDEIALIWAKDRIESRAQALAALQFMPVAALEKVSKQNTI